MKKFMLIACFAILALVNLVASALIGYASDQMGGSWLSLYTTIPASFALACSIIAL